jgi:uncharacterized membrane-anchored protein YhcB (DUF1043 family)
LDVAALGSQALWIAAAVAAGVGLAMGFGIGRSGRSARRVRQLERELRDAREEMGQYRAQVSEHFSETSRLLRDLTLQYRSVYEHLADGARTLCPDGTQLLAPSLAEAAGPALPEGEASAPPPPDRAEPVDLERGGWVERPEPADDLEPLLDESVPEHRELTQALRRGAET